LRTIAKLARCDGLSCQTVWVHRGEYRCQRRRRHSTGQVRAIPSSILEAAFNIHSIVFVHGLWGHPRRTWETDSVRAGDDRPSLESRRKGSLAEIMRRGSKRPTPSSTFSLTTLVHKETTSSLVSWNTAQSQESSSGSVQKSTEYYWPRDLLPLDIPDAKILTYGYDADVIGSSHGDETKLHNFASKGQVLLVKLKREIETGVSKTYLCSAMFCLTCRLSGCPSSFAPMVWVA
jgi:hypothetical protein